MQRSSEADRGQLREAIQCNPSRSVALSRTQSHSDALSRSQSLTAPSACSKKMVCAIRRNASSSTAIHTSGSKRVVWGESSGEESKEPSLSAVVGTPSGAAAVEA